MHSEILTKEQIDLLPLIKSLAKEYCLVGGTGIALYLGHRRSIDFDLFTPREIKHRRIVNLLQKSGFSVEKLLYEASDQFHLIVNSVKITFFNFPHKITPAVDFNGIKLPTLLDLSAMKTYALGRRAKWKDYVDLYFILKDRYDLKTLSTRSAELFGAFFNEKLFREQICFFDDIDFSERIDYMIDEVPEDTIKEFLINVGTSEFL